MTPTVMYRSNVEIGAIKWINLYPADAIENEALHCDISNDAGIDDFCERTGVTKEELEESGGTCRLLGCADRYAERQSQVTTRITTYLFRSPRSSWAQNDASATCSNDDEIRRLTAGVRWEDDSCAIDCAITVAIHLNIWRAQADQIEPQRLALLDTPALLLRIIVLSPWGTLSLEKRNRLRDLLRKALHQHDRTHFPTSGFIAVGSVLDACLKGVPQLSWTAAKAEVCCDEKESLAGTRTFKEANLFLMNKRAKQGVTLQDEINENFLRETTEDSAVACTSGNNCTKKKIIKSDVVLDRMPPCLLVHAGKPIRKAAAATWELFSVKQVKFNVRGGQIKTIWYEPYCVVYLVNDDHFIMRSKVQRPDSIDEDIREMDGTRTRLVDGWWSELPGENARKMKETPGVLAIFFRMIPEMRIPSEDRN